MCVKNATHRIKSHVGGEGSERLTITVVFVAVSKQGQICLLLAMCDVFPFTGHGDRRTNGAAAAAAGGRPPSSGPGMAEQAEDWGLVNLSFCDFQNMPHLAL